MGKTFGNTHIFPRFKNISDNMDLIFFVQVYTNIVLLDEVQSKETIRKIFNNPCIIPQFIYISDNVMRILFTHIVFYLGLLFEVPSR